MKQFFAARLLKCLMFLACLWPMVGSAAPFTPGNIVVVRVGDGGTTALSAAAAPTFLLEYTPAGVLVQTVALPTAVSGSNRILTNTGSSTSDAVLTRSADGRYLVLTGYDAAPGTATLAQTQSSAVNRIIGRIAADGSIDTSTRIDDAFSYTGSSPSNTNIRSAASVDGSTFYAIGSNGGVRYVSLGNPGPSLQLNTTAPTNNRAVAIFDGNLYVSSSSGSFLGVSQVGTGLPTTAGQTITPLTTPTAGSPTAFYFADLSTTVPGLDVVYVTDDRSAPDGGIQKWSLVGTTWTLNGTINSGTTSLGLRGITGAVSGTTVSLIASGNAGLFSLTDNAGYNVAPSTATLPAAIATAGTNAGFRGVAFAPVAGTVAAPTITSFTPTSGAAGSTVTITGTNFTGATAVTLNGVSISGFTVVNGTTITFTVPATGATSGTIAVTTPGGTVTSTGTFTVSGPAAAPTITSLSPTTATAGGAAFTLTVTGTGFVSGSVVNFGSTTLTTTFVSATSLTAAVPATAIATAGTYNVTVVNPANGGTSAASTFTVTAATAAPTITSFTPTSGAAGATVTITGTNFTGATAVTLNGVAITNFTVVNGTTITFTVPATGATSGTIAVTTPGGTVTSTGTFTVTPAVAAPTITSFTPARAVTGVGFTLNVSGTNLVAGTIINFNGVNYTGTIAGTSGASYNVVIPGSGVPAPGSYNITATNTGGTSAPLSFLVVAAPTSVAFEDFETGTKGGYAAGTVTLRSGDWTFTDALIGNQFNDKANQVQSARIRGGSIAMNFDKPNGAGTVTISAALYGNDAAASLILEVSTNAGTTYTAVGSPVALTTTLTPYTFTVNRGGNVRFRISSSNTTSGSNPRINVDDINITNSTGTATTPSQALPGLTVYPNPATDRVTLTLPTPGAATVALRDLAGRLVLAPATLGADKQVVLPAGLAAGVYVLEVRQGEVFAVRRIVKN